MPFKITVIIPNWNGKAFLTRCVGAILQSAAESGLEYEILLVDDASTDGSGEDTAATFSDITYIKQELNQGFGQTVNNAARMAKGDLLILVNNDLIARPKFVGALCRPFEDSSDLFGVSGKTIDWSTGAPNHLNMRGFMKDGLLNLTWSDDEFQTDTLFVQGGSCAFRRDMFLDLGGFHPLFAPGYWEDYDISYQAVKSGYRNIYEPAAIGAHLGQGSMVRAYGRDKIDRSKERNKFLLQALNFTGKTNDMFWKALPAYVCTDSPVRFKHRLGMIRYLFQHRRDIQSVRKKRACRQLISDDEIFARFCGLGTAV